MHIIKKAKATKALGQHVRGERERRRRERERKGRTHDHDSELMSVFPLRLRQNLPGFNETTSPHGHMHRMSVYFKNTFPLYLKNALHAKKKSCKKKLVQTIMVYNAVAVQQKVTL